jgi:phytoene synthase
MFDRYDYALAVWCAPPAARPQLRTLFALDARLQAIMPSAREPMLGAIKLAWWREQLEALDTGLVPGEPLLQAVSGLLSEHITGHLLSALATDGERLLELGKIIGLICKRDMRPFKLLCRFDADDHARMASGRPLASPAWRTLMAAQIRLLDR